MKWEIVNTSCKEEEVKKKDTKQSVQWSVQPGKERIYDLDLLNRIIVLILKASLTWR